MTLDNTITPGQSGHITDHDEIATQINALEAAVTAAGNLPIATAAGALGDLAPGSAGQVLTADPTVSGKAKWATPSAGVGFESANLVGPPAAGSSPGKDKAAFLAARTAAMTGFRGGWVQFDSGDYDVGDLAGLIPEYVSTGKALMIRGTGKVTTQVKFSVDQGLNTFAIKGDGADSGLYFGVVEDIDIVGPGTRGALGTSPANMDGLRLDSRIQVNRCGFSGFRSGVVVRGNHSGMTKTDIQDCLYNVYFIAASTNGDIDFDNCLFTAALFAGIAISSSGTATFQMRKGHLGFGPYCIYIESGAGGGVSLGGVQLDGTSCEAIGNSFLYSEDQNGRVYGLQMDQCGNFSRAFSTYGIAARTTNPAIRLAELIEADFRGGMPVASTDGGVIDVRDTLTFKSDRWKQSYDTAVAFSKPFVYAPANSLATESGLDERGVLKAFTAQCFTAGPITAGQLLEVDFSGRVRPAGFYGASLLPIVGVALNGATASSREQVIVVTKGRGIPTLSDGAAATSYTLVRSSSTVGKVSGIVYDGTTTSTGGRQTLGTSSGGIAIPTGVATVACDIDIR